MAATDRGSAARRRRMVLEIVAFGLASGLLIALLELAGFRFLVVGRSPGIYALAVAALFAGVGIWLGTTLRSGRRASAADGAGGSEGFVPDDARRAELGVTPRELEILERIAEGLSNREIGERLFISETTVKTHVGRILDKLGAKRRTEAVRLARSAGLIP